MSDTQYLAAKTIDEAVQAHNQANGSARFLAGGTDLLVQIKSGIKKPNLVIDVKKIVELKDFSYSSYKKVIKNKKSYASHYAANNNENLDDFYLDLHNMFVYDLAHEQE